LVPFTENNDGLSQDSKDGEDKIEEEEEEEEAESNGGGVGDDLGNDRKPIFNEMSPTEPFFRQRHFQSRE
jgi:hypothetical protein